MPRWVGQAGALAIGMAGLVSQSACACRVLVHAHKENASPSVRASAHDAGCVDPVLCHLQLQSSA